MAVDFMTENQQKDFLYAFEGLDRIVQMCLNSLRKEKQVLTVSELYMFLKQTLRHLTIVASKLEEEMIRNMVTKSLTGGARLVDGNEVEIL